MPPILRFILRRTFSFIITLLITTAVLYATVMLTPAETRAELYMPANARQTEAQRAHMIQLIIEKNHLNDPYPVQYYYWLSNLLHGNWGYSPTMGIDILQALMQRTPATAELALYSILVFIPLGLLSGILAASKQHKAPDKAFRFTAYLATSLPPFILALVLLSIFYVNLHWFSPERIGTAVGLLLNSKDFHSITGLLTIDGLLNGRPDVTLDALRHLAMPVITLAFAHWATLARVTRASMVDEMSQDYVTAAKARGMKESRILWRHVLPNAIAPALTSSLLSAASLITGVFVVEIIFNFKGISEIAVNSMQFIPDAPAALGFTLYSVIVVLLLMFILDLVQAAVDPRLREAL
ncbi:Dipeptide transport system permease protein DppB [bioreactor metagenome]|uniref:Dipeptide transport system permease protein DppB n=1 Tax=bioreactor metagenome TaxID=1076179 RepID=A0A645ANJ2_9ZZZZ